MQPAGRTSNPGHQADEDHGREQSAFQHIAPSVGGVPFAASLARYGDRVALIHVDGELSYTELAERVELRRSQLGDEPALLLMTGGNDVESIITYLAALAGGHAAIVVPASDEVIFEQLAARYMPHMTAKDGVVQRHLSASPDTSPRLHPDLALLLSTSGSTGSPKLVRLSSDNVQSNAESIAQYLEITADDRAITTLPMSYCYGLSVINSHLLVGAAVVLTDESVISPGFWSLFRDHGATSFAGVPYTFELLERVGFADMRLPQLRYVTQAGGRMPVERVRAIADLGRRDGWDLFVMYGQTEATARMSYVPSSLADSHAHTIGRPVPGGSFRLEADPDGTHPDVGELVYRGPNVMLGYAHGPADLARGRVIEELRTGDLARRTPDGFFEVVGRLSRFAKLFGLRIDLDRLESTIRHHGHQACCVESTDGAQIVIATTSHAAESAILRLASEQTHLPARALRVHALEEVPRLPNGKPDYASLARLTRHPEPLTEMAAVTPRGGPPARVGGLTELYADVLERDGVTANDSFVSLRGDSLSFVEMSIRLEQNLGHLPHDWPSIRIADLRPAEPRTVSTRPRWRMGWRRIEANIALRTTAIILIVATHLDMIAIQGGAHILLAAAGYNFARFHLTGADRASRLSHLRSSTLSVVVPSMVWIGLAAVLTGAYALHNVFLMNAVFGSPSWSAEWQFWFIEALVTILILTGLLVAIPIFDRLERKAPFAFAMALVALGLIAQYALMPTEPEPTRIYLWHSVVWLFALGWAAAKATGFAQMALVSVIAIAALPGFFDDPVRGAVVAVGVLLLVWVKSIPWPAVLTAATGVVASSSLYIYLTHWQVYPLFEENYPLVGMVASIVVGVAAWKLSKVITKRLSPVFRGEHPHVARAYAPGS